MRKILMTALASTMLMSTAAGAEGALTSAQQDEVKGIIKKYLVEENPDVIRKAVQALQQREQVQQMRSVADAVEKNKSKIYDNPSMPVLGNPKGDVTIVEFFDYQCGYCKMAHNTVKDALEKDKNLRYVAVEFPILGDASLLASRAALASVKQGKYEKFHDALMSNRGAMDEAAIMTMAKKVGMDADQLKKDMQTPQIETMINDNRALGQELEVRGTPLFIIGDDIRPGAMNLEDLQKAVENVRKKAKK
ncbi:MAG: DsbA family protein [Alphaproteobacteria bacterium]